MTTVAEQFLPEIAHLEADNARLFEQEKALQARRAENCAQIGSAVVGMLRNDGLNLLTNPETAAEVYRAGWLAGMGPEDFSPVMHAAIGLPPVSPRGRWTFGDPGAEGYNASVPVLHMYVKFDSHTPVEAIEAATPAVEAVFETQEQILAPYGVRPYILCGWQDEAEVRICRLGGTFTLFIAGVALPHESYARLANALIAATRRVEGFENQWLD